MFFFCFEKLEIQKKYKFVLIGEPVFIKVPEPLEPLTKDSSITLEYIIDGIPKPTVNWYKKVNIKEKRVLY